MANPLRVGVIGLGPRWRSRYRRALLTLRDLFQVRALCDATRAKATKEARRLRCAAAAGPTDLFQRDDLDVALLADDDWYGLWPVEAACRAGLPLLCAVPLDHDDAHADDLLRQVQESRLPVMVELGHRFAPATARLRQLLDGGLGPARLIIGSCHTAQGHPAGAPLLPPLDLLDWCADLLGGAPRSLQATGAGEGLTSLVLDWEDGRAAQLTVHACAPRDSRFRLQVLSVRGTVEVCLPRRLVWSDVSGRHVETLPGGTFPARSLLQSFHQAVREGRNPQPDLADAHRLLTWLRAALRSRDEGRPITLEP